MGRPDEAPNYPRRNKRADYVSCPDMHGEGIFNQVSDGESCDQTPMEDPYKRIPYINLPWRGGGVGCVYAIDSLPASVTLTSVKALKYGPP